MKHSQIFSAILLIIHKHQQVFITWTLLKQELFAVKKEIERLRGTLLINTADLKH